jgi:6-phosphogluconolactonase
MKLSYFSSIKNFHKETIEFIESICQKKKGTIYIALSGGSTPEPFYKLFKSSKKLPWNRIHLFLVDERYVPINHPDSNYAMIATALGKTQIQKLKNFTCFHTDLTIKDCLKQYAKELNQTPTNPKKNPAFDLTILGIGPDGHTASLFPKQSALTTRQPVAHTTTSQFKVKDRLTITFPVILKSKTLLVLMKGQEKLPTLKELTNGKKSATGFPAKKLLKHKNLNIYFCKASYEEEI